MKIESSPQHCTIVFDFVIGDKNFTVSLYQDLITDDKVVNIFNPDGTSVDDTNLCDLIAKYAIDKYTITYDPGTDDDNLDPII
jgi:hypothetical protein